jgi:tRNA modification GTPase
MLVNHDDQTIIAQCTPTGSGALALLRISGEHAVSIATQLSSLPSKQKLIDLPTHTIHFGWVIDTYGNHIDQVLFLLMRGPKTFTGQDTVEITCHNNSFIIESIIQTALMCGARLAQTGEFTKRAVLNNKIDLIQAEAINELIHANTQSALKKSLAQLEGSFSHALKNIESYLVKALALSEASFEFIDEEHLEFGAQISTLVAQVLAIIAQLKINFDQQKQIREGVRIAFIGAVNAGKSSLFNAILGSNRAIVTNVAGTTRDVIEAGIYRSGNYWTLIDTAGLRQTNDCIEQEGIKRSAEQAHNADIIILVIDSSRHMTAEECAVYKDLYTQYRQKILIVSNKHDLAQIVLPEDFLLLIQQNSLIACSNALPESIRALQEQMQLKVDCLFKSIESPFLLNRRQYNLLLILEQQLYAVHDLLKKPHISYEIVSHHVQEALSQSTELTGKSISEAGMDAVFREFCVGK